MEEIDAVASLCAARYRGAVGACIVFAYLSAAVERQSALLASCRTVSESSAATTTAGVTRQRVRILAVGMHRAQPRKET